MSACTTLGACIVLSLTAARLPELSTAAPTPSDHVNTALASDHGAAEASAADTSQKQTVRKSDPVPMVFGEGGQIKMLYDCRQRPQAVYLNGKVHIVFNAGGARGVNSKFRTSPMAITYDPEARQFSEVVALGPTSSDHHDGPVIWADDEDYLHVLFGCHKTPGTHLISRRPGSIGSSLDDWKTGSQIAPSLSYPTVFSVCEDRELIYYRTEGHSSAWTYRMSSDNGMTWIGPETDVTDMDCRGRTEWSSYQTKLPSRDGAFLHVAFMAYDDVKSNDPRRLFNPRYDQVVTNAWKYNLYYVKIDLRTHAVTNFDGRRLRTPVDLDQADAKCRIWDTQWRGAGIPPTILLDENESPTFLDVLSQETIDDHQYYYVRHENGRWKQTPITHSNHQWNSCHLTRDDTGTLHAYLVTGEGYLKTGRDMDRYGGGRVEEWISNDKGDTWHKARDLTPDESKYPGWRYNNIQPVTKTDGSSVDGMLLFYGWSSEEAPEGKAFLLHE